MTKPFFWQIFVFSFVKFLKLILIEDCIPNKAFVPSHIVCMAYMDYLPFAATTFIWPHQQLPIYRAISNVVCWIHPGAIYYQGINS